MTDRAPIPAEAFEDALDRLDRDALAAFVGRLEAATGGDVAVDVDPPIVTVDDGDGRERIFVDPGEERAGDLSPDAVDPAPDAVVAPDGSSATGRDATVRTTEDLRQQLLYAVSPEVAESIAEEWLGAPARSASYATESPSATDAETDSNAPADDSGSSAGDEPSDPSGGPAHRRTASTPEPSDAADDPSHTTTRSVTGLVVAGVLVAMILAVTGGVVYAAEVAPDGDAGAFAAPASIDSRVVDADLRRRFRERFDEGGATTTPMSGEEDSSGTIRLDDTEADRNVRPVPTCERSFLNVVQLQMNALKYNNNTTNDGIRTVRRFASPENRRTIRNIDDFVTIIKSPTYSPMLSYDSAQYTPFQSSDDYAQVRVVTREDGTVTGRYYFRLDKVDRGEYEGCWMTDAVVSVPEANNFSGQVAGRSTGSSTGA